MDAATYNNLGEIFKQSQKLEDQLKYVQLVLGNLREEIDHIDQTPIEHKAQNLQCNIVHKIFQSMNLAKKIQIKAKNTMIEDPDFFQNWESKGKK
tara:strand:- start:118 stop:402 length:285 start_codon:yes stop_codon:yes gene_type:complete